MHHFTHFARKNWGKDIFEEASLASLASLASKRVYFFTQKFFCTKLLRENLFLVTAKKSAHL
ncbi:MAG: hypothetical protein DRR16_14540 [Candidatus Parabeggiatoa sp. nov. 3]|jgi:hypothetical protein|nr:MAG: hypothetical protein DRR00_02670 [Gammaproteobacteria bacterium]RKZ69215.1 MAG: hypothetical protein DRQ99_01490 [Gammaproteobacteria bacterium]RKZ84505.1 MAG: hypothetical protein DRR16_14540 [Gammaproteobacteria bacterium]